MPTNESGIDSDLIRGHIDTIILKALFEGDKYGYEICKEVEERSGGTYELKQPTLYSCLKRLESQKLISSYWTDSEIGGKRHYYKLTELGKETCQKNQDDWNRSRVIIDSLISNGEKPQFIISETSSKEIDNLQKQVEELKKQLENEKQNKPEPEEKIVYVPSEPETKIVYVPIKEAENENSVNETPLKEIETDQTDGFIPWQTKDEAISEETDKTEDSSDFDAPSESFAESIEDENDDICKPVLNEDLVASSAESEIDLVSSETEPEVQQEGEQTVKYVQLSDNFVARVASNGEILSVEKAPIKTDEDEACDISETCDSLEESSPAQASVFEESSDNLVFDEDSSKNQESEDDVDIMALLGHTAPSQIENTEKQLIETSKNEQLLISKEEKPQLEEPEAKKYEQSTSPFVFKIDDDFKSNENYFESQQNLLDESYVAPVEKINGKEVGFEDTEHSLNFDFEKFKEEHSDKEVDSENENQSEDIFETTNSETEETSSVPVYHNFGAINRNYEEADLTAVDPDAIYKNPDKEEKTEEKQHTYSLFDDEDLIETNDFETDDNTEKAQSNESSFLFDDTDFNDNNGEEEAGIVSNEEVVNEKPMPFYESTDNYDSMKTNYTDEKYKEKLSSLMTYQTNDGARENYKILTAPKDFKELQREFEEEGIIVKPHTKMVKESKSTRSYVETNKLNVVNSWTAYGIVAFFVTLTFLIMNNYKSSFSTFDFSAKYFLIGLAILMIVPIIYSVIYFINPYKKKPARYAHRIYLLFALLLTIQLLIIIYSINLQLGFYSIHQENYNHLYWIVPTILSAYPLVDAILHGVYFSSRNFHI